MQSNKDKTKNAVGSAEGESTGTLVRHWQDGKATIADRFAIMFNNELLADVHFLVGCGGQQQQRIPAHKLVLSVASAVFDAMFNGTLATKTEQIELTDVEPAAFLPFLEFLYSDKVVLDATNVMMTWYTAKKYAVSVLEKHCVLFLKENLAAHNVFLSLKHAQLFGEVQLVSLCWDYIDEHTKDVLHSDAFADDLDLETLCAVLERSSLTIQEFDVFEAVVRWARMECIRKQLLAAGSVSGNVARPVRHWTSEKWTAHRRRSGGGILALHN